MTLNGIMAVALRYFTDFGKFVFQHNGVDLWRNLCTSLLCFAVSACTMSSVRKFTFAISSPDEFLVHTYCSVSRSVYKFRESLIDIFTDMLSDIFFT